MQQRTKSGVAIALVAVMVLSVLAAPGIATTPTIDTTTTDDTATASQMQDQTTLNNVSGLGNTTFTVQVNVSPNDNVEMKVRRNASAGIVVARNTSPWNVSIANSDGTNTAQTGAYYNLSFTESEIDDMQRDANANVTTDVTVYDADNETGNATRITVYLNFSDNRHVENVVNADADGDIATLTEESGFLGVTSGTDQAEVDKDDINVTSADAVVFALSNDSVNNDFDTATDDTSFVPLRGGTAESGDWVPAMTLRVTDDDGTMHPVPVFYESAPDAWDEDQTYGIYTEGSIGGQDGVVIHKGDDLDDTDQIDVEAVGGAGFSKAFGVYGARTMAFGPTSGFSPLAGAGLLGINVDALTGGLPGLGGLFATGGLVGAAAARRRRAL